LTTSNYSSSVSKTFYATDATNKILWCLGHFVPNSTDCALGIEGKGWAQIWSKDPVISGSDKRIKNTITPIPQQFDDFFNKLIPTSFKYNDGTSDRKHIGFIA
jgi:hypothetical protein